MTNVAWVGWLLMITVACSSTDGEDFGSAIGGAAGLGTGGGADAAASGGGAGAAASGGGGGAAASGGGGAAGGAGAAASGGGGAAGSAGAAGASAWFSDAFDSQHPAWVFDMTDPVATYTVSVRPTAFLT